MNMIQIQEEARFLNIANQLALANNCVATFDLENQVIDFSGKKEDCERLAIQLADIFSENEVI